MTGLAKWLLPVIWGVFSQAVWAHETRVLVGGYNFPPYLNVLTADRFEGATVELLEHLNALQDEVHFLLAPMTASSRYVSYRHGRFDVIFFESADWWQAQEADIEFSAPIAVDRDLYIALDNGQRDQSFFNDLSSARLIAAAGYHYGFADFDANQSNLEARFNISFAPNPETSLVMLERDRGDVALVNESFLVACELRGHPLPDLLVAEQADRDYQLSVGVRPQSTLALEQLVDWLQQLRVAGRLAEIEARWGIHWLE